VDVQYSGRLAGAEETSSNRSQGALPTLPSRMACLGLVKQMLVLAYRRVAVSKHITCQVHVDLSEDFR
jgi:hypothetical protein